LPLNRASAGLRQYLPEAADGDAFPAVQLLEGAANPSVSADHDRIVQPAQTVSRLRPHFQTLGITRLGELTGLDRLGIPVAFASRPNSFSLSTTLGKGIDRESALASAAMEAAEAAVAEKMPAECIQASLDDLQRNRASVIDLTRIARCQPERLVPDTPLDWVNGLDLITGQTLWLPWELVGLDHRLKPDGHHDAFEVATDGLASGNVAAEAVLHGIYELIERDAHALLELLPSNLLGERLRDPSFFNSETLLAIKQQIEQAGLALHLLGSRLYGFNNRLALP
jgi:YcaO-like protein with predicted kinase domain